MKGRCIGVSLSGKRSIFFHNNKTNKPFPGVLTRISYPHSKNERETPQCIWQKGSVSIEASIIIPLYVCFLSALLFFFRVMQVQLTVQGGMEEVGRSLAILSSTEFEKDISEVEYLGIAKGMLWADLQEAEVIERYVMGGPVGVSLLESEFEGDYISLKANYILQFPVKLLGKLDIFVHQNTRFRKWTGWHDSITGIEKEQWVYVTEYGEVCHMRRSCPYLQLKIREAYLGEMVYRRNQNGERYEACERCVGDIEQFKIYITDYGDKYHYSVKCGGLKRTIYQKKYSEVEEMRVCSKCWK